MCAASSRIFGDGKPHRCAGKVPTGGGIDFKDIFREMGIPDMWTAKLAPWHGEQGRIPLQDLSVTVVFEVRQAQARVRLTSVIVEVLESLTRKG